MGGLFSKPKINATPAPAPVAPSEDKAATQAAMDAEARAQVERLQRGRTATMVTGEAGLKNKGKTSKMLLGQ